MYYITILEFAFETQFVDYAEVCLMDTQEYSVSTVLSSFSHCELPNLTDYSVLNKVDSEEFFFDPPLKLHEHLQSGPFILISSPGAVGKTTLAKHIAYKYHGLYWNTAAKRVSGTAFAGEVAHAVGIGKGQQQDLFYENLKSGKSFVVLDAFDEAALISQHEGIESFLEEIGSILRDSSGPSIILTARTEMAEFLLKTCQKYGFGITHYSIEYFHEASASEFIYQYLSYQKRNITAAQKTEIQKYIDHIASIIGNNQPRTFIGYAQVLRILARQVEDVLHSSDDLNSLRLSMKANSSSHLIYSIIQELLLREQKKLDYLKDLILPHYKDPESIQVVKNLYSKDEQLLRLMSFITFNGAISVSDYDACSKLLQEDQKLYQEALNSWLPQHVFLQERTVMPIFKEYLLAETLLNPSLEIFSDVNDSSIRSQIKLPSRVFLDCYLAISKNTVQGDHIFYIDVAYLSQTTVNQKTLCDIGPLESDDIDDADADSNLYLTFTDSLTPNKPALQVRICQDSNKPIYLNRLENMSVNFDGRLILKCGLFSDHVSIRNSTIECDTLELAGSEIVCETYNAEENRIIIHSNVTRAPGCKIIVRGTKNVKIDIPPQKELKQLLYEFSAYWYSFDSISVSTSEHDAIEQFVYGLKKVLEQFKVDKYGDDPAKFKDKIDARCHTGVKSRVLNFLKDRNIVYEDDYVYKCSLHLMDEYGINRTAYIQQNCSNLSLAYNRYIEWFDQNIK